MSEWELDHNVVSEPVVLVDGVVIGSLREPYASQAVKLQAINAKLLAALEAIQKELFEYSVANNFGKSRIVSRCIDLAREAIREASLGVQKAADEASS
jgi:hypothetical protein